MLSFGWALGASTNALLWRLGLRRTTRLSVPVISVGNIAVGGTGKTPFVIWLAGRLRQAGHRPGILARGYGDRAVGGQGLNDEGAVIAAALGTDLPQIQDPDRVRGGLALLEAHPDVDVILLDDGLQHRRLVRDLDIVLLDGTSPFGYGYFLPRGLLREAPKALKRAGVVVLTRTERISAEAQARIAEHARRLTQAPLAFARGEPAPASLVGELSGARVLACCGIGNPEAFFGTLEDLGATVVARRILADHEALPDGAWPDLVAEAKAAGAECVVITRKDAVKAERLPAEVSVVDVEMVLVEGEARLWEAVEGVFKG